MPYLAMILFLPWFAVLAAVYLIALRRRGRGGALDWLILLSAAMLSGWAMHWGYVEADRSFGNMWPQVLATLLAYAAFLAVLALALPLRWRRQDANRLNAARDS